MFTPGRCSLYAIVDFAPSAAAELVSPLRQIEALAVGGATHIQLRAKSGFLGAWAHAQSDVWARAVALSRALGFRLVLNDDLPLAFALAAAGQPVSVHLGQEDLAATSAQDQQRLAAAAVGWGLSTHSLAQVRLAQTLAPDYIGFGPVFSTRSKLNADPSVGLPALREACAATALPVVAIGGIGLEQAPLCAQAGAAAVASISALRAESAEKTKKAAQAMLAALSQH